MTALHIIDDDPALGDSLAQLVAYRLGWQTTIWTSAATFLARAATLEPAVLLVDHHMPGTRGVALLEALAGDARFVSVLMTGGADIPVAVAALRAGASHLIEKPFETQELIASLEAAAARLAAAAPRIDAQRRIARLSPRERDVLDGMLRGHANKVIAMDLGISPRTIEVYRAAMMGKLHAASVAEVLQCACTAGMVPEVERRGELAS
jgi:two-component system response regulator FixJ